MNEINFILRIDSDSGNLKWMKLIRLKSEIELLQYWEFGSCVFSMKEFDTAWIFF